MKNCIFCKIVKKEIPSYIIYEDDFHIAFLDIAPMTDGHTVLIPKEHSENLSFMNEDVLFHMGFSIKKVIELLKEKLKIEDFNIISNLGEIAGQSVFHTHIHIIPRYNKEEITIGYNKKENDIAKIKTIYDKII